MRLTHVFFLQQEGHRLGDHMERTDASLPLLRLHLKDQSDPLMVRKQVSIDIFIMEMSEDACESYHLYLLGCCFCTKREENFFNLLVSIFVFHSQTLR